MSLTPNKSDILAHLTALFPPSFVHKHPEARIEIAYGMPDIGPNNGEWFSAFEPERAVDFAAARNIEGNNIYVGAALRIGDGTVAPFGRGDDKAFLAAAHGWIDLDGAGECEKADAVIKELQLEPSIVVTTGTTPHRRMHAYFPIKDGIADGEQLRAANTALRSRLGGDPVQAPSHVMRLAGTVNYPSNKKRARGYVAELVTLRVEKTARAHAVEDIIDLGAAPSSIQGRKTSLGFDLRRSDAEVTALLKETRTSGHWHNSMRSAIASMVGRGWEDLAIRLTCGPYCHDGPMDPDLDPLINGAREKWNKPEPSSRRSETPTDHSWSDPDWSLLDDRRGELPEFPLGVLPKWVRDWAALASHGAGVTPSHVVVPLLGVASSIIGSARRVQASRSWLEPMTCWTAVVGYSGTGKTPGIDVTKRHLAAIEKIRAPKVAELKRKHETRAEAAKAALKKWKEEVEDAVEAGMPAPPRPVEAEVVGEFVTPRLYISDSTIERIAILLQASPRGALVIADELAGLFLNMGRYSNGSDREFWLEAWNGKGYVVERMGRPAVHLENLLVGIVGGLQPDKLVKSFEGDHDGMYARVCFSWPEEPAYKPLTNDVAEIEPDLINALSRLIDLEDGDDDEFVSRPVRLSSEATEAFEQFRQFLHDGKAGLDGRGREWWSKGASHVLRLAGTLTFLEWSNVGGDEPAQVQPKYVEAAIELWRNYFWPHSQAALRQIGLTERHANARQVLRWIGVHGKREISTRDIRRDALGQRLDAAQTSSLVEFLVEAGWLKPLQPVETGGRPARRWLTNEVLHRGAESAESAESTPRRPQTPLSALPALSAPGFGECLETVGAPPLGPPGDSLDDF